MSDSPKKIFSFLKEFPPISTGIFLIEKNKIITGHYNGFVVLWDINSGKHEKLFDCNDTIETISESPNNEILVGCNSGLIFYFELDNPQNKTIIQETKNSKFYRVWRSVWPTEDNFFTTSTYGGLNRFKKNTSWKQTTLSGHYHSIFGIANSNGKYIASGDYKGNIIIWKSQDNDYLPMFETRIESKVEDIVWIKDEAFATIDDLGHINVIEYDSLSKIWKIVTGVDIATSVGKCIHVTEDGETIFAGTNTEIIQYDLNSQTTQAIQLEKTRKIFSKDNIIYILTQQGLFSLQRTEIKVPLELIKYQYAKISIVGHTSVGKSTFCKRITDSSENVKSTFGKKIWTWTQTDTQPERRIIFHDHGGQETVLSTFLPFLSDSNIVLIFFSQKDNHTFQIAMDILNELKSILTPKSKIFFVQTYIDEEIEDIDSELISKLIDEGEVENIFKISPKTNEGVPEFIEQLAKEIDWANSKTMGQSAYVEGLMKTLTDLSADGTVVDFYSIKNHFEEHTNLSIPIRHLNFLLSNFSSQGLIEYYPEIWKKVIFYADEYNKLRTNVPIRATQRKGIISIKELEKTWPKSTYLSILDSVFLKFGIAIKNRDLRIFPSKLKTDGITISEKYQTLLKKPHVKKELQFSLQKIRLNALINSLVDLKLDCIDASKSDGLFSFDTNACLYYVITEKGDSINGRYIQIGYSIGGTNQKVCERLDKEFSGIISRLFGKELSE